MHKRGVEAQAPHDVAALPHHRCRTYKGHIASRSGRDGGQQAPEAARGAQGIGAEGCGEASASTPRPAIGRGGRGRRHAWNKRALYPCARATGRPGTPLRDDGDKKLKRRKRKGAAPPPSSDESSSSSEDEGGGAAAAAEEDEEAEEAARLADTTPRPSRPRPRKHAIDGVRGESKKAAPRRRSGRRRPVKNERSLSSR